MVDRSSDRALFLPEFIHQVFSYLDHPSNAANARVCKQWSEVAFDHLWRDITDIYVLFSRLSPLKIYKSSWKFHSPPGFDSWADFSKISRRVRTLCYDKNTRDNIHHSVFDDIARTRITFNFLPNLHTLEWLGDVNHCVMFMQKNVQNFHIRIPNGLTHSETRSFFQNITGRMPDLIRIDIRMDASVRGIEVLLLTLLCGLPKLRIITLPLFWLTSKLTECLSNHHYLHKIDFEYGLEQGEGKPEDVLTFKPSLNHGAFPLLRDLSFCSPFNKIVGFFEMQFSPVNLTALYIYSHKLETREMFRRSIITISNSLKALTSLSLVSLFSSRGPPPSPDAYINIDDIVPLFVYPNLSRLEFVHHFPLKLVLEDAEQMVQAWPKMETLLLNHTPGYIQETPTLSFDVLFLFTSHCPRLRYLGLYMDASTLELPRTVSTIYKQPFTILDKLSVGLSPINDAALVALFLSRICPNNCELNFGYSEVKDTQAQRAAANSSAMEARILEWEKVAELMPILMMARLEERSLLKNTLVQNF